MSQTVIIVGAGGHGRVIAEIVRCAGDRLLGYLDDAVSVNAGLPVLGPVSDWPQYAEKASFILGIGANESRCRLSQEMDVTWYTACHPTAISAPGVEIGEGTVLMPGMIVNPGARIGRHCILNTGSIVEHDCFIADFVHISPGAVLCGTVHVGQGTHIGAGAVVKNQVSICSGCTIGAGAVVVRDITQPGTYVGVPARLLPRGV